MYDYVHLYTIVQTICIEFFFFLNTGSVRIFKHMFHSLIREADIILFLYINKSNEHLTYNIKLWSLL